MAEPEARRSQNPPVWHPMTESDLDFVEALAAELYPEHPESRAAFASKLAAARQACHIARTNDGPVGYCFALWARRGVPPRLDEAAYVATRREVLHLHDIAVSLPARGQGLVARALERLSSVANGAPLSLVAVHGTRPLWERHGFAAAQADADVLRTYGSDAVYMVRTG